MWIKARQSLKFSIKQQAECKQASSGERCGNVGNGENDQGRNSPSKDKKGRGYK